MEYQVAKKFDCSKMTVHCPILLSRMASKVYLIYKGGTLGGDKEMTASLERKENVELVPQSSVKTLSGNNSLPYKQIVAACAGDANAGLSAFNYVEKLKGKPGIRADWKKTIGDTVFHY